MTLLENLFSSEANSQGIEIKPSIFPLMGFKGDDCLGEGTKKIEMQFMAYIWSVIHVREKDSKIRFLKYGLLRKIYMIY